MSAEKLLFSYLRTLINFKDEDLVDLSKNLKTKSYNSGDYIFQENERYSYVSFIVTGLVKKYYLTAEGREFIKEFCSDHEFIAPYSSLLQGKLTSFSIQCLENTDLISIKWDYVSSLFSKNIRWMEFSKKVAELQFITREQRESELLKYPAKKRLEIFKQRHPDLYLKLKKQDVAAYLGITPVSLSRIL